MIIKAYLLSDDGKQVAESTIDLNCIMSTELELCTKSMIFTRYSRQDLDNTDKPTLYRHMLHAFLRLSSLGIDAFLAEYGKVRLREKRKEAMSLIPKGP